MTGSLEVVLKLPHCYRAFLIGANDRVQQATELLAESDDEAASQAQLLVNGNAVELWNRTRMIARFEPAPCDMSFRPGQIGRMI